MMYTVATTKFTVNGKNFTVDTAWLSGAIALGNGADFETMFFDDLGNYYDELHAKTFDEALTNHRKLVERYTVPFGVKYENVNGSAILEQTTDNDEEFMIAIIEY